LSRLRDAGSPAAARRAARDAAADSAAAGVASRATRGNAGACRASYDLFVREPVAARNNGQRESKKCRG
jgi:hypothetical protein